MADREHRSLSVWSVKCKKMIANHPPLFPCLLIILISPFFTTAFNLAPISNCNYHYHQNYHRRYLSITSCFSSSDDNDVKKSVADTVGYLHGGKYQFDSTSNPSLPGGSGGYEGSWSCEDYNSNNNDDENIIDEEEWPRWARNMEPPPPTLCSSTSSSLSKIVDLNFPSPSSSSPKLRVEIRNDERTWEKFFVTIHSSSPSLSSVHPPMITAMPRSGTLAPRGGASNACDSSKPYADSVTIVVSRSDNTIGTGMGKGEGEGEGEGDEGNRWCWLIIGTEDEKWYHRIYY